MVLGQKRREKVTFEIKEMVLEDIKRLSEVTRFDIDEIVNVALEQVLSDNKHRFVDLAVYEHFMNQLNNGQDEFEPFCMGCLFVELKYNADDMPEVHTIIKDGDGNVIDDSTKTFPYENDEMEKWLKNLGLVYLDDDFADVKKYAINRTDYKEVFSKEEVLS